MREVLAFFPEGQSLLVRESLRSGNNQDIYRLDIAAGERMPLLPHGGKARYLAARLFKDGSGGLVVCDQDSDAMRIGRFAADGTGFVPAVDLPRRDTEAFALSPDQQLVDFIVTEEGWSRIGLCGRDGSSLRLLDAQPPGVITSVAFTPDRGARRRG